MGFDCGFDISPRLEPTEANKQAYRAFLAEIIATYQDTHDQDARSKNGKVLQLPDDDDDDDDPATSLNAAAARKANIYFMVGECPCIPANPDHCEYFLRFSSKVSGGLTACAAPYIRAVCRIAKKHFGDRVHFWHEMCESGNEREQWGWYSWSEVYEAKERLRELEGGEGQGQGAGDGGGEVGHGVEGGVEGGKEQAGSLE